MARVLHVFEVTVVRSHVWPNEDLVTSKGAERFSVRAGGDLSANRLASEIIDQIKGQDSDLVSSSEVHRIVNGKRSTLSTAETYRANARRFGRGR